MPSEQCINLSSKRLTPFLRGARVNEEDPTHDKKANMFKKMLNHSFSVFTSVSVVHIQKHGQKMNSIQRTKFTKGNSSLRPRYNREAVHNKNKTQNFFTIKYKHIPK